jgi:hypothetical protein
MADAGKVLILEGDISKRVQLEVIGSRIGTDKRGSSDRPIAGEKATYGE